jgi:predicted Zn-dependent protease with MMP-like domain
VDRRKFHHLVQEALGTLPPEFRERLHNVEIFVEDEPSREQMENVGLDPAEEDLFGIYEGVPLTDREHNFGMVLPDRITIFYRPLVESFQSPAEIREQIRITVIHEIAHFFGMDEDEVEDLGY